MMILILVFIEGKIDINAPVVVIDVSSKMKPETETDLPKPEIEEDNPYNAYPPLRESGNTDVDVLSEFQTLPYKRTLDNLGVTEDNNPKRQKTANISYDDVSSNFTPETMFPPNVALSGAPAPPQQHDNVQGPTLE